MTRHAILWISSLAVLAAAQAAFGSDHIRLTTGTTTAGDVTEMNPNEVKVDVSGIPKTFPVNQIEYIQFDGEPKDLTDARSLMRAGKLAEALTLIRRVKAADVSRDDVKQEVEFYRAILMARLALAGSGSLKEAGKLLFDFESAARKASTTWKLRRH